MTVTDRERHAQGRAFQYQAYQEQIQAYMDKAVRQNGKAYVGGSAPSYISDPTGRAGVMLASLPDGLELKRKWVKAIDDAWDECRLLDGDNRRGMAYVMEKNFRLTGEVYPKEKNAFVRQSIIDECGISKTTYYDRLMKITGIIVYHATAMNLI